MNKEQYFKSKIRFYLPTFTGRPIQYLFDNGWRVSYGFKFLGIIFKGVQDALNILKKNIEPVLTEAVEDAIWHHTHQN